MKKAEYPRPSCREGVFSDVGSVYPCEIVDMHPGPHASFSVRRTVEARDAWEEQNPEWEGDVRGTDVMVTAPTAAPTPPRSSSKPPPRGNRQEFVKWMRSPERAAEVRALSLDEMHHFYKQEMARLCDLHKRWLAREEIPYDLGEIMEAIATVEDLQNRIESLLLDLSRSYGIHLLNKD